MKYSQFLVNKIIYYMYSMSKSGLLLSHKLTVIPKGLTNDNYDMVIFVLLYDQYRRIMLLIIKSFLTNAMYSGNMRWLINKLIIRILMNGLKSDCCHLYFRLLLVTNDGKEHLP